jgi:hypothetical protein
LKNHYEAIGAKQQADKDMVVHHDAIAEIAGNQARWIHWRKGIIM